MYGIRKCEKELNDGEKAADLKCAHWPHSSGIREASNTTVRPFVPSAGFPNTKFANFGHLCGTVDRLGFLSFARTGFLVLRTPWTHKKNWPKARFSKILETFALRIEFQKLWQRRSLLVVVT